MYFLLPSALNANSMILFDTLITSKWGNVVQSVKKLNVEIDFALPLQLIFPIFSRMGLKSSIAQNCLNKEYQCDLS